MEKKRKKLIHRLRAETKPTTIEQPRKGKGAYHRAFNKRTSDREVTEEWYLNRRKDD